MKLTYNASQLTDDELLSNMAKVQKAIEYHQRMGKEPAMNMEEVLVILRAEHTSRLTNKLSEPENNEDIHTSMEFGELNYKKKDKY